MTSESGSGPQPAEESALEEEFFGDGKSLEGEDTAGVESPDDGTESEPGDVEGVEEVEEPTSIRDRLFGAFSATAERVKNRFTGEVNETDQESHETSKTEFAGAVAAGLVGIAMTRTGTKFFADLPQYATQKYFTSKERSSILSAIETSDLGPESNDGASAVERKNQMITDRINESTFLTEGKKAELIGRLTGITEKYSGEFANLEEDRNQEFAEALEESIQSRISNTAMLKETLNTALIATGIASLRTVGYSAVALYERHKKVSSEMKEGKREGNYFSELVAGGAKETWSDLTKGGDGETLMKRNITRAKAAGILLRGAAMGHLAGAEIFSDENIMGAINKSVEVFQEQGVAGGFTEHFGDHFGELLGGGDDEESSAEGGDDDHHEDFESDELAEDPETGEAYVDQGPEQLAAEVDEDSPEITVLHGDELERATVGADSGHNSITALLKNQIMSDPEKFGYEGDPDDLNDWAADQATEVARSEGLLSATGDVRLTSGSIDNLIVQATEKDGEIGVHFIDSNTGKPLDVDGLQDAGYTYEHSSGAAEEVASVATERPDVEVGVDLDVEGEIAAREGDLEAAEAEYAKLDSKLTELESSIASGELTDEADMVAAQAEAETLIEEFEAIEDELDSIEDHLDDLIAWSESPLEDGETFEEWKETRAMAAEVASSEAVEDVYESGDAFDDEIVEVVEDTYASSDEIFETIFATPRIDDTGKSMNLMLAFEKSVGEAREAALNAFAQHEIGTLFKDGYLVKKGDGLEYNGRWMDFANPTENADGSMDFKVRAEGIITVVKVSKKIMDRVRG
ncbi:hypothetical protein HOI83_00695 [Candidatus Uhrbacteria bacterium]|jgi:hypothetical protein|nr:hypothetical protein [Candidatus Uhrbacteria bacterium]